MPETPNPLALSPEQPNAIAHNAEIATQLAEQGRESLKPGIIDNLDASSALGNLRAATLKKKTEAAAEEAEEVVIPAKPIVAPDATVAPAKPDIAPEITPVKPDVTPTPATDIFSGIQLPANIKPKSAEAFAAIKSKALEEISAKEARIAELEAAAKESQEKANTPHSDEILKELEDHRNFRAKLDVDADPRFKAFDKEISDNHAFIYSQLRKSSKITAEHIEQIKKQGGPSKVDLERIFEAVADPAIRRSVEAKVADEEMILFRKEQAVKEQKENIAGYLKEREDNFTKASTAHNEATKKQFTGLVSKMDWVKERQLPKDADDAVKAEVKSHNDFVASTKKDLEAALHDDSPDMRAILLAGMGQLLNLQRVHANVNKELAVNKKLLEEATDKLTKIKNAGKTRLQESSAPTNAKPPESKKDDFSLTSNESLAQIRNQIIKERAEKAAA